MGQSVRHGYTKCATVNVLFRCVSRSASLGGLMSWEMFVGSAAFELFLNFLPWNLVHWCSVPKRF